MSIVKQLLHRMWERAVQGNLDNLIAAGKAARPPAAWSLCDLGSGDGKTTIELVRALEPAKTVVVETHPEFVHASADYGFRVVTDDLNAKLTIPDDSFDIVVSNQVIEHLYDTELFLDEAVRITKPGGTVIVSTENAASWHNIAALTIGWQAFSLSNISSRASGVGNPFSLAPSAAGWIFPMQHHRIFTPKALKQLFSLAGLEAILARGAGYYPLPGALGAADVTHAAFIVVSGRKPLRS